MAAEWPHAAVFLLCLFLMLLPPPASATDAGRASCDRIAEAARGHGLAPAFLARVLWESGTRAPPQAVAAQLAGWQAGFGNPGLAALAFAAGAAQVRGFLDGAGLVPAQVDFIILTTGQTPEFWRDSPASTPQPRLAADAAFGPACHELLRGRWGAPLPALQPLPEPGPVALALVDPALRSLRPRLRAVPPLMKWGAQLAFGKSRARARANFDRSTRSCRQLVGTRPDIVFVENRVRGRPGYWMARVSRAERSAATDLCRAARRAGCACAVYKNY